MNTHEAFECISGKANQLVWDLMSNYPRYSHHEELDTKNKQLVDNIFKALCSLRNSIEDQLIVAEKEQKARDAEINEEEDFLTRAVTDLDGQVIYGDFI